MRTAAVCPPGQQQGGQWRFILQGVRIFLREPIFGRIVSFLTPASFFAGRVGWAAAVLLLFFQAGPVHAGQPDVTIVLSEDGGPYAEFAAELTRALGEKTGTQIIPASSAQLLRSGLVVAVGMKAATAAAGSDAKAVLNVLIPKSGYEGLLRDFPQRAKAQGFSAIYLDQSRIYS